MADERKRPPNNGQEPVEDGEVYITGGRELTSLKEAGNRNSRLIFIGSVIDLNTQR